MSQEAREGAEATEARLRDCDAVAGLLGGKDGIKLTIANAS